MAHRLLPGRRALLKGTLAASAGLALPAFTRSGRPSAEWGVQAGDVTRDSALVWVRSGPAGADDRRDVGHGVVP
ncbi:hypothetical protein STENM223S_00298 [Streptomyces tendae]